MADYLLLREQILKFRDDRDWKQFHNPKDMAISLAVEAAEVMEHFQWKNSEQIAEHIVTHKEEISDELADVMMYLIQFADVLNIDLLQATEDKLKKVVAKYPIDKAKGKSTKYTDL